MRKIIAILLMSVMAFSLAACKPENDKSHDEILSEIAEKNGAYNEKRKAFMSSEVYDTAYAYVSDVLEKLLPGCEIQMSLEPGNLIDADLNEFADFSGNEKTRRTFFGEADLYIKVNFWSFDMDASKLCSELMSNQISGRLAADEYGADIYRLDAASSKYEFEPMPEV